MKGDLVDRRVRLNLAIFQNDFKGLQRPLNNPAFPVESVTTNAADARIRGIESELLFKASDVLTLGFNAAYLDDQYKNFFSNVGGTGADLSNLRLGNAPKFQSHLFADVRVPFPISNWSANLHSDRKRVVSGKRVSVSVDLG